MRKDKTEPYSRLFLAVVDSAYRGAAWHGPALRNTVRDLTATEALYQLRAGGHNIWELVLHCAYWKYRIGRSLSERPSSRFPLRGTNWFVRDPRSADSWNEEVLILDEQHERLREAILALSPARLASPATSHLVHGIAMHDAYHAGQIKLIRRYHDHG
jgi:DinB family protein